MSLEETSIEIERLTDYSVVAEASAITQGWDDNELTLGQWQRLLLAEHSPIYALQIKIRFDGVPYYIHVQNVRHHVGVQHYVRSQRPDSMNPVDYDRAEAPQGAPVDHMMIVNPGSLINIGKERLCFKAWKDTRNLWWRVKRQLEANEDLYLTKVGQAMRPKCYYQGVCPEPEPCKMQYYLKKGYDEWSAYRVMGYETEKR